MSELVIFVGLQGSGKSTWYRTHFAATHVHVSKDLMPGIRNRDAKQQQLIADALGSGVSVVVDNTNATLLSRAPLIELGRRHGAKVIAYYFDCDVKICLVRNRAREGRARVPDAAIFITRKKLVPPVLEEGFDEVRVIRDDEGAARGPQ